MYDRPLRWWWDGQLCLFTVGFWTVFLLTKGAYALRPSIPGRLCPGRGRSRQKARGEAGLGVYALRPAGSNLRCYESILPFATSLHQEEAHFGAWHGDCPANIVAERARLARDSPFGAALPHDTFSRTCPRCTCSRSFRFFQLSGPRLGRAFTSVPGCCTCSWHCWAVSRALAPRWRLCQ